MNQEESALHKCRPALQDLLSSGAVSLTWLITELVAGDFIDGVDTNVTGVSDGAKVSKILEAVQVQVRLDPTKFYSFVSILKKKPALRAITENLTRWQVNIPPQPQPVLPIPGDPLDKSPIYAEFTKLERTDGRGKPINIAEALTPKWKSFACMLDFDDRGDTISFIEANNRSASDCCQQTLKMWIDGNSRSVPKTWKALIKTIKDVGHGALANDVEMIISSRQPKME